MEHTETGAAYIATFDPGFGRRAEPHYCCVAIGVGCRKAGPPDSARPD